MRNVDKIKGLRNQLDGLTRQKQMLSEKAEALRRANMEIQAASNAVIISIALAHGAKLSDGSFMLAFPKTNVLGNIGKYTISAKAEGQTHIITVSPIKEAEHGTDEE